MAWSLISTSSQLAHKAINGSSPHKVWPYAQVVMKWILDSTPLRICILSDPGVGKELQAAILKKLEESGCEMARVHPMGGGAWNIRQALTFCQVSDCVVGPETGPLNAVCMEPMPKVIMMSHSSTTNLVKHWVNTMAIEPDVELKPACYPCHRLHYKWDHCVQDERTHAAACAAAIRPETVFEAIAISMGAKKKAA